MNQNAHTWLEMPALPGIGDETARTLNDRMRTIAAALDSISGGAADSSTLSGRQLLLSVPGTLGIRTDAAPRVSLPVTSTPTGIVAILKQPPQGASVKLALLVAGAGYTLLELPVGSTLPVALVGGLGGAIPANALLTLNLTQVGTTFPGADLSVMLRF